MNDSKLWGNIHSIERFGTFDGPGIRYVVFLQGCPFRCKFCHNRDTWSTKENKLMSAKDIISDYLRYASFYKNGGITVSGGEPLFQIDFLIELFALARKHHINTCLDTSSGLFDINGDLTKYKKLFSLIDYAMIDIKHIDPDKHKWLTQRPLQSVLDFIHFVDSLNIKIFIRHVIIPGVNLFKEDLLKLRHFLDTLKNVVKIEILKYHTKGIMKWDSLKLDYPLLGTRQAIDSDEKLAQEILCKKYKFRKDKEVLGKRS